MASQFSLIEGTNVWGVMWPMFPGYLFKPRRLLDVLFEETECSQANILIELTNKEYETFTVDKDFWLQDKTGNYGDYLQSYYIINGATFKDRQEAVNFHTWLEKAYVWHQLKA